jgi:hypothetical protein
MQLVLSLPPRIVTATPSPNGQKLLPPKKLECYSKRFAAAAIGKYSIDE